MIDTAIVSTPALDLDLMHTLDLTPTSLAFHCDVDFETWERIGKSLQSVGAAIHWWIGDWLNYGEGRYGERYSQAIQTLPFVYPTLTNDAYVARHVMLSRRRDNITFAHHYEVAALPPDEQDFWLDRAVREYLSVKELRQQIRSGRLAKARRLDGTYRTRLIHGDMLDVMPTLGHFDLVVTDPPYGVLPLAWDDFEDYLRQCHRWLGFVKAALAEEYNLFWFCSPSYSARVEEIFRDLELPIRSRIVWHRRSLPKGRTSKYCFLQTWDMILHAGTRPLNFPPEWSDAWFDVQVFSQPLTSSDGVDQRIHETQKPSELVARLVEFGSFPGDRVLDPFAGSGVVGAVCPPDRECILIEKDNEYIRRIETRLGIRAESAAGTG